MRISPVMAPIGMAHISSPVPTEPAPSASAYGAASDSGATRKNGGSQARRYCARMRRSPKSSRRPARDDATTAAPPFVPPSVRAVRAGLRRVPRRSRSAEARKPTTVATSAVRGDATVRSSPPAAKPTSWAPWETMRIRDRPRTKRSPAPRMSPRVAALVPPKTGATAALRQRRASSATTGMPGSAIAPALAAHSRSQTTSTRRAG